MRWGFLLVFSVFATWEASAGCSLGVVNCPAVPGYTLDDINSIWLKNGDPAFPANSNESACIAAAQDIRNVCRVEAPTVAVYTKNSLVVSATLLRRYQNPAEVTSQEVAPPPAQTKPAGSCIFENLQGKPIIVANGASVKAAPYEAAPINKACASQSRTCSNGVLSGTYKYLYSFCTSGF